MPQGIDGPKRRAPLMEGLVLALAMVIAAVVARPYAGSWNDGSRLATVEALVDDHTWIIDSSIFARNTAAQDQRTPLPYPASDAALLQHGTLDKMFIAGHYYSDKSPVPALWMAGCYRVWQTATGWTARVHADRFCRDMTLASSGLAYVIAVWCVYRLGRRLRLPLAPRLVLTASFALATTALPYAQQVNNHILLLAVTSALALAVLGLREEMNDGRASWRDFAVLGTLAGLGYTIDLGVGPVILLCTAVWVLTKQGVGNLILGTARKRFPIAFFASALPWLVLHHALNYMIGGTLKPANANAAYFRWPGSPFTAGNLTGSWIHADVGSFLLYAASMVAGKRGFLGHNLPLFLTVPAVFVLFRRQRKLWPELLWALGCCIGTWLLYAATSNNSSGQCCTIRWFVPLLAPGYFILALLLQRYPRYRFDLLLLSGWGTLLVALMHEGPWKGGMVPFFWPMQILALVSWLISYLVRRRWTREQSSLPSTWQVRLRSARRSLVAATQHPYTKVLGNPSPREERPSSYG